jgi:hypothetical protein
MLSNKIRHWAVALGLVAIVCVTAASASGLAHHAKGQEDRSELPVPSGDLGEVIVHGRAELGDVVPAIHDLGEVLVTVHRMPADGAFLAEVVVTVPRAGTTGARADGTAATLAAVQ